MSASQRIPCFQRSFRGIAFYTLLFVAMFITAAQATDLPVQGGPGGSYFRRECSGDHLVGIYVRSGLWVDAIGLKCATFDQAQGTFKFPPWNTPYYGAGAAPLHERVCPNDNYVSGIRFNITQDADSPFIDFIELTCTIIAGFGGPTKDCIETGEGCYAGGFVQTCPDGEVATGIQGRAGLYVDAIGLICGPKPGAQKTIAVQQPTLENCPNIKGDEVPAEWSEMLNAHN